MRFCFALASLVLGAVLGALAVKAADAPRTGSSAGPALGEPAPAFSLKTLDGKTVTLQSYKGKTLVLNVWATWCPPCRAEMPGFITLAPKLANAGVAFLGVDTTEGAAVVRAYAAAKAVPYLQALDSSGAFAAAYDVQYFPTTYVIDARGIVRARYIDELSALQLTALVDVAKRGENAQISSPLQRQIDAALAEANSAFPADSASAAASAKRVQAAIVAAEKLLEQSDAAKGNPTDFLRTRNEEAAVRDKAIAALVDAGMSVDDRSLLPRLRGDAARDREQWQDALDAYDGVLTVAPGDEDALAGIALAAARLKRYDVALDAQSKLATLSPADVGTLVELARLQAKSGRNDDALATFTKTIALESEQVRTNPGKASAVRMLAYAHLYAGRAYAERSDAARARTEFLAALNWAQKLPLGDERHDMYLEEAQEALVALGLSTPAAGAALSLAPWTGGDLPGSIPNTFKYRLVVAGSAGGKVALRAEDVPKGWVASFCSDRVCAPFRVTVDIPESGLKVVEFQLVPPSAGSHPVKVRVVGNDGRHESSATT